LSLRNPPLRSRQDEVSVIFNKSFGRFRLVKKLAMGGMAEVYLALRHGPQVFDKLVALKCILPHVNEDATHVAMFYNEARIGGLFRHPNLISVHDAEVIEGRHTLVMEFVAGQTLEEVQQRMEQHGTRLPLAAALHIMARAARGLAHAHEIVDVGGDDLRLVHRDISPQNIMVAHDGRVKVFDFGLAVAAAQGAEQRELAGKTSYMSPEQVRGRALDGRSDLFSLGIVLHELVTGQRLFQRDNQMATIKAVTEGDIPAPSSIGVALPPEVDAIVMRCLERSPDARFQDGWSLAAALDEAQRITDPAWQEDALALLMQEQFSNEIGELDAVVQKVLQAPERSDASIDLSTFDVRNTRASAAISPPEGDLPARPTGIAREEGRGLEALTGPHGLVDSLPPPPRPDPILPQEASAAVLAQLQRSRQTTRLLMALCGALLLATVAAMALRPGAGPAPGDVAVMPGVPAPRDAAPAVWVLLTSQPEGAAVWVNGEDTGLITPAQLQRPAGISFALQLRRDGYLPAEQTALPTSDAPLSLHVDLLRDPDAAMQNGSVLIAYEPADATVFVNQQEVGSASPVRVDALELYADHSLRIEKLGFEPLTDSFRLDSDSTRNFQFQLVPAEAVGTVNIRSTPPGATIRINGEQIGVTPLEGIELVADQQYSIQLERDGFVRFRTGIMLEEGSVQNIDATLQRVPQPTEARPVRQTQTASPEAQPAGTEPTRTTPSYRMID
jgi:serine/threonine-protein kinase